MADVFEINDFTAAVPLEALTFDFEKIVTQWNLIDHVPIHANYTRIVEEKSAKLSFGGSRLKIIHFVPEKEEVVPDTETQEQQEYGKVLMSHMMGFEVSGGYANEFGVGEYLLITSADHNTLILNETQARVLIGSIRLAFHTTGCSVPVFVQCRHPDQNLVFGFAISDYETYGFESSCIRRLERSHSHLTGLLQVFKNKFGIVESENETKISTRFHYAFGLRNLAKFHHVLKARNLQQTPIGPMSMLPFISVTIRADWKCFSEGIFVETETASDFNPTHAGQWSVSVNSQETKGDSAFERISIHLTKDAIDQVFGVPPKELVKDHLLEYEGNDPFQKLTSSRNVVIGAPSGQRGGPSAVVAGPLPYKIITEWINIIFGDESFDKLDEAFEAPFGYQKSRVSNLDENLRNFNNRLETMINGRVSGKVPFYDNFKSAPENTIVYRLAVAMAQIYANFPTEAAKGADAQLWIEFTLELRKRFDEHRLLENIDTNSGAENTVDTSQCELSQMIHMLSICSHIRFDRFKKLDEASKMALNPDDTYSDCETGGSSAKLIVGRVNPYGDMMLIGNPSEKLYVPHTQVREQFTERMMESKEQTISAMSPEDRLLANLEPLKSDMSSFKEANPGCEFIDFIRWHSPKDYDDETGELSARMSTTNNTWLQCWDDTKAVAAIHQKRIFNDTKVSEEIFETFEHCDMAMVKKWLKPVIFVNSFKRIFSFVTDSICRVEKLALELNSVAETLRKATIYEEDYVSYEKVNQYLLNTEQYYSMTMQLAASFFHTLPPIDDIKTKKKLMWEATHTLIQNCLKDQGSEEKTLLPENYKVKPNSPIGIAIAKMCRFQGSTDIATKQVRPERREYIMHWIHNNVPDTVLYPPQRMYVCLEQEFAQVCCSTGADATFSDPFFG